LELNYIPIRYVAIQQILLSIVGSVKDSLHSEVYHVMSGKTDAEVIIPLYIKWDKWSE
jgi:hypothetical protein